MSDSTESPDGTDASAQPLYRQVATSLLEQIRSGLLAVGEVLPREVDLAAQLGVSRVTLRQALDILEKGGVIRRVRRLGTQVIATEMAATYVQQMDGLDSILHLAGQTAMTIQKLTVEQGTPDPGLEGFDSITGHWLKVEGVRHMQGELALSTWSTVYVDHKYSGITPLLKGDVDSVFALVEKVYGHAVHRVRHRIGAAALPEAGARRLKMPVGAPMLEVQAWLHAADGSLIEYVRSLHNPAVISIELSNTRRA